MSKGHPEDELWSAPESGTVRDDDVTVDQSERDDYDRPAATKEKPRRGEKRTKDKPAKTGKKR